MLATPLICKSITYFIVYIERGPNNSVSALGQSRLTLALNPRRRPSKSWAGVRGQQFAQAAPTRKFQNEAQKGSVAHQSATQLVAQPPQLDSHPNRRNRIQLWTRFEIDGNSAHRIAALNVKQSGSCLDQSLIESLFFAFSVLPDLLPHVVCLEE